MSVPFAVPGNKITVTAPPDATVAPVGFHMLWLVDENGVPATQAPFVRRREGECCERFVGAPDVRVLSTATDETRRNEARSGGRPDRVGVSVAKALISSRRSGHATHGPLPATKDGTENAADGIAIGRCVRSRSS